MPIQYLQHNDIDKQQWDNCISNADNGLIYAYSLYLDSMAKHWDALVLNDYEAVMPLTWNKKYGFYYLYQPFFTAALGVFGKKIPPDLVNTFLTTIPEKFRYWDFYLNHGNHFTLPAFDLYQRMNYILPLNNSYEMLFAGFRDNTKRNIKKATQSGCTIKKDIPVDDVITLAKEQAQKFSPITSNDYDLFKTLFQQLQQQQKSITYGVYTPANELVASCVFLFSHKRAYYILVGNHPNNKVYGASYGLIDAFIKDHAGQELLLDFEGSDIRSLAFFYNGFGAREEKFAGIKLNKLPKLLRLLKK